MLCLSGQAADALIDGINGLAEETPKELAERRDWLTMTVSMLAFETGDWALARAHLGAPPPSQVAGTALIFRHLAGRIGAR